MLLSLLVCMLIMIGMMNAWFEYLLLIWKVGVSNLGHVIPQPDLRNWYQ